jgi:hypothetical protein
MFPRTIIVCALLATSLASSGAMSAPAAGAALPSSSAPPASSTPPAASAAPGLGIDDRDRHAPVLCDWGIFLELKDISDRCFASEDQPLKQALSQSIADMDKFIIRNSKTTQAELDRHKAQLKVQDGDICKNDEALEFYKGFRTIKIERIRQGTAVLLEIPREPVAQPCL